MRRSMRHSWTQRAEAPLHIRLLGSSRLHDEEADLEHLEIPFGTQRVAESPHCRSLDGLGTERPVELFYKLVLVDIAKRSAVPLCQFVHTGEMHRMLHDAHLRADGRGIDYSGVAQDLDVMKVIDRRLYDPIIAQLRRAVENNGRGANAALAEARRTKLTKHHPELAQLVEDVRRIH